MSETIYQPELWLTPEGQQRYAYASMANDSEPQVLDPLEELHRQQEEERARLEKEQREALEKAAREQAEKDNKILQKPENQPVVAQIETILQTVTDPTEQKKQIDAVLQGKSPELKRVVNRRLRQNQRAQQAAQQRSAAPKQSLQEPLDVSSIQDERARMLVEIANSKLHGSASRNDKEVYNDLDKRLIDLIVNDTSLSAEDREALRRIIVTVQDRKNLIDQQAEGEQREWGQYRFYQEIKPDDVEVVQRLVRKDAQKNIQPTPEQLQDIDRIFNELYSSADNQPREEFSKAFDSLYDSPKAKSFIKFLRDNGFEQLADRYATEDTMRQVLHNANYVVAANRDTKQLSDFLQGYLIEYADIALSKKGVSTAMHLYDQALRRIQAENGGYIPNAEVLGNPLTGEGSLDKKVEAQMLALRDAGLLRDKNGNRVEMKDWEMRRALSFARGMGVTFGTTLEILAQTKLPPGTELGSLYAQDIIKHLAPFQHVIGKFSIGKERLAVLGYKLATGNHFWTHEELDMFKDGNSDLIARVFNGFEDEEQERFLADKNPFLIGGIFSKTGWRIGSPDAINPMSALTRFSGDENKYIGTGIQIEKLRGDLASHDHHKVEVAQGKLKVIMKQILDTSPLKLFYNDLANEDPTKRTKLEAYMKRLGIAVDMDHKGSKGTVEGLQQLIERNPWLSEALDDITLLQESATRLVIGADGKKRYNHATLDFSEITDPARRAGAQRLVKAIREQYSEKGLNAFIKDFTKNPQHYPFVFGTEDIPYEEYDFTNLGGTAVARRWRDIKGAVEAGDGLTSFLTNIQSMKGDPEKIIGEMRKIYNGISAYDEGAARKFTAKLAKGVIRFYQRNWATGLPLLEYATGHVKSSFAQTAYGQEQAAWDATAINIFVNDLEDAAMLDHHDFEDLLKATAATTPEVIYEKARRLLPLIALGLAFFILSKALKDSQK